MTATEYTPGQLFDLLAESSYDDTAWLDGAVARINRILERGDKIAVYENHDLGHPEIGHRQYVSYGSLAAQLGGAEPPERLPDIGGAINWRYVLVGTCTQGPVPR